eukprot:scaffold131209_cov63-Phaeocystis_antarctica.AAC.2
MGSRVVNGHFDHALVPRCHRLAVPGQSGARCRPARSALAAPAGPACPTAAEGGLAVAGWALGLRCGPALHQASASPCASRCGGRGPEACAHGHTRPCRGQPRSQRGSAPRSSLSQSRRRRFRPFFAASRSSGCYFGPSRALNKASR